MTMQERFNKHREEAMITCPEDCWCWDIESLLAVLTEKEGELWNLTYQLDMAQERTADLEKVVKVFQDDTVARKFHIEHLEDRSPTLPRIVVNGNRWQKRHGCTLPEV